MGILLKMSLRKPVASCFDTNFDFLNLQISHTDLTKYFLFFVTNPFEFQFLTCFLHLRQ